jgi:S-DNA-T family DNA segregation ATPase FtsK/SpoIIIE
MRRVVTGEEIAQLRNPDPFAVPAWRSPVYRTPLAIVAIVHAIRLLYRLVRLLARHPVLVLAVIVSVLMWRIIGWPGLTVLAVSIAAVLVVWRWRFPVSFSRFIGTPARGQWRAWHYRRRWAAVMTIGRLAPMYQGRVLLPVLGKVSATAFTDRVRVRLVSGQSAADFAARADNLAHGFGAMLCRIRSASRGRWCWSSSAATPWPPSSPPWRSPPGWTCRRCRSAAAKTVWPGWSASMAPMS